MCEENLTLEGRAIRIAIWSAHLAVCTFGRRHFGCGGSKKGIALRWAGREEPALPVGERSGAVRADDSGGATAPAITRKVRITQREISNIIGMSRESTNKQLRAWEDRKWVRLERGGVAVLDHAALAKVASEGMGAVLS